MTQTTITLDEALSELNKMQVPSETKEWYRQQFTAKNGGAVSVPYLPQDGDVKQFTGNFGRLIDKMWIAGAWRTL